MFYLEMLLSGSLLYLIDKFLKDESDSDLFCPMKWHLYIHLGAVELILEKWLVKLKKTIIVFVFCR